jgi:hypothetical protein
MNAEDQEEAEEVLAALTGEHAPELVYSGGAWYDDDEDHAWHVSIPAEICRACSDPEAGIWVPASFCPQARARMGQEGSQL